MEINEREIEREYNDLIGRLGRAFAGESGFRMAQNYIKGLLGTAERKNGWQLAEYLGNETPYAIQRFLYRGRFSAGDYRAIRMWLEENRKSYVMCVSGKEYVRDGYKQV
ncbi:MAG: hypothetical protein LBE65_00005 [Synergistaceae bacterium]|jgi:hypothetical protein|nr:hypothetical protein [Synergistaceae bacterium]